MLFVVAKELKKFLSLSFSDEFITEFITDENSTATVNNKQIFHAILVCIISVKTN